MYRKPSGLNTKYNDEPTQTKARYITIIRSATHKSDGPREINFWGNRRVEDTASESDSTRDGPHAQRSGFGYRLWARLVWEWYWGL